MLKTLDDRSDVEALVCFEALCCDRRSGVRGLACLLLRSGVPRGVTFSLRSLFGWVLGGRSRRSGSGITKNVEIASQDGESAIIEVRHDVRKFHSHLAPFLALC